MRNPDLQRLSQRLAAGGCTIYWIGDDAFVSRNDGVAVIIGRPLMDRDWVLYDATSGDQIADADGAEGVVDAAEEWLDAGDLH